MTGLDAVHSIAARRRRCVGAVAPGPPRASAAL